MSEIKTEKITSFSSLVRELQKRHVSLKINNEDEIKDNYGRTREPCRANKF